MEFYLLQFHILMSDNAKMQLVLVQSPMINLILSWVLFVICATTAFDSTKVILESITLKVAAIILTGILLCGIVIH